LPQNIIIPGLNDSKKLSQTKREELYFQIKKTALDFAIGLVSPQKIDEINILQATFLAMREAINKLTISVDFFLVDGPYLPNKSNDKKIRIKGEAIIRGDQKFFCIAAASILAKVTRDNLMLKYHKKYPHYDFLHNKGYPTRKHIEAINKFDITPIHRKTFSPIAKKFN